MSWFDSRVSGVVTKQFLDLEDCHHGRRASFVGQELKVLVAVDDEFVELKCLLQQTR